MPPWNGLHESSLVPVDTLSCPVHWAFPTFKQNSEALGASASLSAEHLAAMAKLPRNADMKTVASYVENITHNSFELRKKASEMRRQRAHSFACTCHGTVVGGQGW